MITKGMWGEIRKKRFIHNMSERSIAKELRLNRRTVHKYINSNEEPRYHRRAPFPDMLKPLKPEIDRVIEAKKGKITARAIYNYLTLLRDHEGKRLYKGSYGTVYRYVKEAKLKYKPPEAFLRLEPGPGEKCYVDWFEIKLIIDGKLTKVYGLAMTSGYSRRKFAMCFKSMRQECLFQGITSGFESFGGVTKKVVLDNTKTVVLKVLNGRNRVEQEAFTSFRAQFPFEVEYINPGKPHENGKAENEIKYFEYNAFAIRDEFSSIEEVNEYLFEFCNIDGERVHGTHKEVINKRFEEEKASFRPLPDPLPECCKVVNAKVNRYSEVNFETNRYSVPTVYVTKQVTVKAFVDKIKIYFKDILIAEHKRIWEQHKESIDPYHYLDLLIFKHKAIEDASVVKHFKLPRVFNQQKDLLLERGYSKPYREWALTIDLTRRYPLEIVSKAIEMAINYGAIDSSSVEILARQIINGAKAGIRENPLSLEDHPELLDIKVKKPELSIYNTLIRYG